MKKVVSIHTREFLAEYRAACQRAEMHELAFLIGILIIIGLSYLVYVSYGGPVSPQVFAATVATGVCGGVLLYREREFETATQLGTTRREPPSAETAPRKAA